MDLPLERCTISSNRSNLLTCSSKKSSNRHSVIRLQVDFDQNSKEVTFSATYLGSVKSSDKRKVVNTLCLYSKGREENGHCHGLLLTKTDLTVMYVKVPTVGLVQPLKVVNNMLDLDEADKMGRQREFQLETEYEMSNDLINATDFLFFQQVESPLFRKWKEYDQVRGDSGLIGSWRSRLQINSGIVKETLGSLWKALQSGQWPGLFGRDSEHDRFLGLDQEMVVLTKKFKIHKVGWDGLQVSKTVDLIDAISIYMSPDFENFWGSQRTEVMTWIPITLYLSDFSGSVLEREVDENEPLLFEDPTVSEHRHLNPTKLTYDANFKHHIIQGCNLHQLDEGVDNKDFFVVCVLSAKVSPYLIFKMKADDLTIIPLTVSEMRRVFQKLDVDIDLNTLKDMINKPPFPFKVYLPEEKPKPHKFLKFATFDSKLGVTHGRDLNSKKIWNINLTKDRNMIRAFRSPLREGEVTNINQVSGNLVLQKVNDANIVFTVIVEKPQDTPKKDEMRHLNLMIVDVVTGRVLKNVTLAEINKNDEKLVRTSLKMYIEDHIYYLVFNTAHNSPLNIMSVGVFRRSIQQDIVKIIKDYFRGVSSTSALDHLSEEPQTVVLERHFTLPADVSVLGFSTSKDGVTQKSVFLNRYGGEIFAIPQSILSPQRMTKKQKEAKEKHVEAGTLHYTKRDLELQYMLDSYPEYSFPDIELHSGFSISRDARIARATFMTSKPTFLESTSLILCTGEDWFAVRYYPDGLFDRVNPDFKKTLLIVGIVGIFVLILFAKFYENIGIAKKRYLSQDK